MKQKRKYKLIIRTTREFTIIVEYKIIIKKQLHFK